MNKNRDDKKDDKNKNEHSPYVLFLILILLIMSEDIINIIKPFKFNYRKKQPHRPPAAKTSKTNNQENTKTAGNSQQKDLKILPALEKKYTQKPE